MKKALLFSLLILTGCAEQMPYIKVRFDSKPRGARVFVRSETPAEMGFVWNLPWDPIGTTPFTWKLVPSRFTRPVQIQAGAVIDEGITRGTVRQKRLVLDAHAPFPKNGTNIFFDFTEPQKPRGF